MLGTVKSNMKVFPLQVTSSQETIPRVSSADFKLGTTQLIFFRSLNVK